MKPTSVRQCSRSSRHRAFARTAALVAALCALAFANFATADIYFTAATDDDWNDASNWDADPAQVPTSADTVYINSSRIATIDSGDSGEADVVRVGYGGGQSGTLNANGNLTASSNVQIGYGAYQNPASGTFNLGDNTTVTIGGSLTLGEEFASGTLDQGADTSVSVGGILTVGGNRGGSSEYTVPETGTLTLSGDMRVGYGAWFSTGTFTYKNPDVTLNVPGNVTVGWGEYTRPASGTFNLDDNTKVTIVGNLTLGEEHAYGTFNQGANTSVSVGGILTVGGIGYAASTYTVPETGTLTLGSDLRIAYGGWGATGTFTYSNSDVTLNVPGNVTIGLGVWNVDASGTFNQGSNTSVTVGGTMTVGSGYSNSANGGVYTMGSGSSLKLTSATSDLLIGYATSDLAKGSFTCNGTLEVERNVIIGYSSRTSYPSTGSFTQGAGSDVTIKGALTIGGYGSTSGVYNLGSAGLLTVNGATVVSAAGNTSGTFNLAGGTADLQAVSMGSGGTIEGYGTISGTTLTMNGTVRASGGTLDLSGFTSISNTSGTGWFVENGGAITLPTTAVAAGSDGDFTWGALATAVNSVDLDFTGVTGGNLSITVLDPDTDSYLPGFGTPSPTTGSIVSLWEIDGSAFTFGDGGTVSLVFRYDDSRLAGLGILDDESESELKVYHYTGSAWELLETTINPTANTASVTGITSFSPFAVGINISGGIIPEPASFALLTLGTAWLLNRRRGRSTTGIPACRPTA